MIPLTLLCGFLGAGKTTVLNRLLAAPGMEGTAVVVNEFGEIGLDHHLIVEANDGVAVIEGGCLCCAHGGAAAEAVARLIRARPGAIRRIVLETSGAADPAPVAAALLSGPGTSGQLSLRRIVTVVDAALGGATLPRSAEARRQVALADMLLLSKTDIAGPRDDAALSALLRASNPRAPLVRLSPGPLPAAAMAELTAADECAAGRVEDGPSCWDAAQGGDAGGSAQQGVGPEPLAPRPVPAHSGSGYVTASVAFPGILPRAAVEGWIDGVMSAFGSRLLRVKGILNIEGFASPVALHAVQQIVSAPELLPAVHGLASQNRIVLIAEEVPQGLLDDCLVWLSAQAHD